MLSVTGIQFSLNDLKLPPALIFPVLGFTYFLTSEFNEQTNCGLAPSYYFGTMSRIRPRLDSKARVKLSSKISLKLPSTVFCRYLIR